MARRPSEWFAPAAGLGALVFALLFPWLASAQLGRTLPNRPVELVGQVVLEHGGAPSDPVRILVDCLGRLDSAGITDRYGRFRFRFDPSRLERGICQVYADGPGLQSSKVTVPTIYPTDTTVNLGRIRISDGSPGMVSVTSAEAPKSARKKLDRARKMRESRNPDLARAASDLRAAVKEYDRYAEAWLELGEVLEELERPDEALEAYGKAIEADPGYVLAYRPAIKLANGQGATELMREWCEDGVRVDPTLRDACSNLL